MTNIVMISLAEPGGRAFKGVGLRSLTCFGLRSNPAEGTDVCLLYKLCVGTAVAQ